MGEYMSYRFFQNRECEYFPCHAIEAAKENLFNCLFCFCPLYHLRDCGGHYKLLENGVKDCSCCTRPHFEYDYVIERLSQESESEKKKEEDGF